MNEPIPSEQVLFGEVAALRRLAAGLLQEPEAADDVLQQAWLAVRQQREMPHHSGNWIRAIVRNLSLEHRRKEARRRAHERRAATAGSHRSAAEDAGRLELMRALVDALEQLEEPYRATVMMRFIDQLPPREIARRQGVPVSTVRTRVRRGLIRLRERIGADRRWDSSLALALVQWVARPEGAAAAVVGGMSLGAGTLGVWTMATIVRWTAAAAAMLIGGSAVWVLSSGSGPERDVPGIAPDDLSTGSRVAAAAGEAGNPLPRAPEIDAERVMATAEGQSAVAAAAPWRIEGRARSGADEGVPGAPIRIRMFAGRNEDGEPLQERSTIADASGEFTLSLDIPSELVTIVADAALEGHRCYADRQTLRPDGSPGRFSVTLLPFDHIIEGVVTDPRGDPIADAEVFGRSRDDAQTTDEAGRFRLPAPPRSDEYVYAVAEGFTLLRTIVKTSESGAVTGCHITLTPEFRIEGRVVDSIGQPVSGAVLSAFFSSHNEAVTDAAGRFVLAHLDPARDRYSIQIAAEGFVLESLPVTREDPQPVELTARRGVRVEGTVVGDAGEAVEGARLFIGFSPSAWNGVEVYAGADGGFVFPCVAPGAQRLEASAAGLAPRVQTITVPAEHEIYRGLQVLLSAGHFIGGVVRDEAGTGLVGVGASAKAGGEYIGRRTTTGPDGRFRLEGLPAEGVSIEFFGSEVVRQTVELGELDHTELEVTLQSPGRIAGRVVDGFTGEPLPSFRIRLTRPLGIPPEEFAGGYGATWGREGHVFTNPEGHFRTDGEQFRPGGWIAVEASAAGYSAMTVNAQATVDPDPDAFVIRLVPGARVFGRVLSALGAPVQGAQVLWFDPADEYKGMPGEPYGKQPVSTDRDGFFAFDAVPPGERVLLVEIAGHFEFLDGPFDVPEAGTCPERTIVVPGGSRLSGTVRSRAAEPLSDETVVLFLVEGDSTVFSQQEAITDADGAFEFLDLPDGRYQLSHVQPWSGGKRTILATVVRIAGADVTVDLQPAGQGRVIGTVRGPAETPDEIVVTFLARLDGAEPVPGIPTMYSALAIDGAFEVEGLPPGSYSASIHWMLDQTQTMLLGSQNFTLEEGGTAHVALELKAMNRRR